MVQNAGPRGHCSRACRGERAENAIENRRRGFIESKPDHAAATVEVCSLFAASQDRLKQDDVCGSWPLAHL
jgi:hypothetical protein